MAALAIPVIEQVVARVLVGLGIGAATGAAAEAARRRQQEAEEAKSTPVARAETQTKSKEKCKDCEPDKGAPFQRNFPVRKDWVDYQARVTGMPNGSTFIMEWNFNGVKFDGFVSAQCLLQEAKGGYDQFFDEWGEVLDWWRHNVEEMMKEMSRQNLAAVPRPPARLEWYWQQPASYRYFSRILEAIVPDVAHHYFP